MCVEIVAVPAAHGVLGDSIPVRIDGVGGVDTRRRRFEGIKVDSLHDGDLHVTGSADAAVDLWHVALKAHVPVGGVGGIGGLDDSAGLEIDVNPLFGTGGVYGALRCDGSVIGAVEGHERIGAARVIKVDVFGASGCGNEHQRE